MATVGGVMEEAGLARTMLSGQPSPLPSPKGGGGVFKTAAATVLRTEKRLMSTGDITRAAVRMKLIGTLPGKTPEATMASALYTDIKKGRGGKSGSLFCRPCEGMFGLREWEEDNTLAHLLLVTARPGKPADSGGASRRKGEVHTPLRGADKGEPSPRVDSGAALSGGPGGSVERSRPPTPPLTADSAAMLSIQAANIVAARAERKPGGEHGGGANTAEGQTRKRKSGGGGATSTADDTSEGNVLLLLEAAEELSRCVGDSVSAGSSDNGGGSDKHDTAASPMHIPKRQRGERGRGATMGGAHAPPLVSDGSPGGGDDVPPYPPMEELQTRLVRVQSKAGTCSAVFARAVAEYAHACHLQGESAEAEVAIDKAWEVFLAAHPWPSLLDARAAYELLLEDVATAKAPVLAQP